MLRDVRLYLEDIVTACEKIDRYSSGMNFDQFKADDRTYDAVIRNLEIIGEAARNISLDVREQYPAIEWRGVSAFRNILAHQYFAIKDEIVWDVVCNKIPLLNEQIQEILKAEDSTNVT
jgi:uncharacterized protein with HEPN domain